MSRVTDNRWIEFSVENITTLYFMYKISIEKKYFRIEYLDGVKMFGTKIYWKIFYDHHIMCML